MKGMTVLRRKSGNLFRCFLALVIILGSFAGMPLTVWASDTYTVTFATKIIDVTVPPQQVAAGGLVSEPPTPAAPNDRLWKPHVFEGWYKDTFFQNKWNFETDTVNADTTLHAKWLEVGSQPYTIHYVLDTANGVVGTAPAPTVVSGAGQYPWIRGINEGTYHTNPDMEFVGWSITPDRRLEFKVGDTYRSDVEGVILYDVWELKKDDEDFPNAVTIDWNDTYQTIEGFGASPAYHKSANYYQLNQISEEAGLPEEENLGLNLLKMIHDPETGLGINIIRLIVGDGGILNPNTRAIYGNYHTDGSSDSIWPEKEGGYVWDQPDWETKKENFDKDQIWYAQKALEINPDLKIISATWSPPYWMKANNSVTNHLPPNYTTRDQGSGSQIRLLYEYYDEFADYLTEYCLGMYREFGIPIYGLSPTNECEKYHDYPTYVIRGEDYQNFLLNYLKPAMEAAKPRFAELGIDPPIIMAPDASRLERAVNEIDLGTNDRPGYGGMMANPDMKDFVGIFNAHAYAVNLMQYRPKVADGSDPWYPTWLNDYELWETEVMQEGTLYTAAGGERAAALSNGSGMPIAIYWARVIANMFASEPGYSAFSWWWGTSISSSSNGTIASLQALWTGATPTGTYMAPKKYFTFLNFSRFVKPGFVRIGADQFPARDMNVTAYKDPESADFAIVVINEDTKDKTITFTFDGAANLPEKVVPYRTSVKENLRLRDAIPVEDGSFVAVIPAGSVTTFVPDEGNEINVTKQAERDMYSTWDGDDFDEASETGVEKNGDGSVTLSKDSYIKFGNINFKDGTHTGTRVYAISMRAVAEPVAGGVIDIRVDDPETGKIVGRFDMRSAAEDGIYTAGLDVGELGVYGLKDLYLVARGGGGELMTINSFTFNNTPLDRGENLITNGDMESTTVTWSATDGATTARYTARRYRGSAALHVTNRTTPGSGIESNPLSLTDGQAYTINAHLVSPKPDRTISVFDYSYGNGQPRTDLGAKIELVYYKGESLAATQTLASRDTLNAATWSQLDGTFVYQPPQDVEFDSVKLKVSTTDTTNFIVDDVFLTVEDPLYTSDIIQLTTGAHLVKAGDSFTLNASFTEQQQSNAAILTYTFDDDKFAYVSFTPAEGVTTLNTEQGQGFVKITVMSKAYDLVSFGDITLRAKDDAKLRKEYQTVGLEAEYVLKDGEPKIIEKANTSARFTTWGSGDDPIPPMLGDTNDDGVVDLIDLSNIIDWFGTDSSHAEWETLYTFFDFNNSADIDIIDIAYVASLIK